MCKEENVIKFYVLCNKLKNVIRTGWKNWHVNKERLESVAEHIYGVQMLAIAIYSEYKYDIDIKKVIYMLAIHELEEIFIGDLTVFEINKEDKKRIGKEAVDKILKILSDKEELSVLIDEFEKRITKEAKFAYFCDKLECCLQAKIYDEDNCVDLDKQENNSMLNDSKVKNLLNQGKSWGEMWLSFWEEAYEDDKNFIAISTYAQKNDIKDKDSL